MTGRTDSCKISPRPAIKITVLGPGPMDLNSNHMENLVLDFCSYRSLVMPWPLIKSQMLQSVIN